MKKKTISPAWLLIKVQREMRAYGFLAKFGVWKTTESFSSGTNVLTHACREEDATGQAQFSQRKVAAYLRLWTTKKVTPGAQGFVTKEEAKRIQLPLPFGFDVGVSYTHWNGGANGFTVPYEMTEDGLYRKVKE